MSDSVTATAEELSEAARLELRLFLRYLPSRTEMPPALEELQEQRLVLRMSNYRVYYPELDATRELAPFVLTDRGLQVACILEEKISPKEISPELSTPVVPRDPATIGDLLLAVATMAAELESHCQNRRFRLILEGPAVAASIKTARAYLRKAVGMGDVPKSS